MHITKAPHCNQAELCGALGANNGFYNTRGGRGARVKGSVRLQKGTQLRVLISWAGSKLEGVVVVVCYKDGQCNKPCPGNDGGKSFSAGGVGGYNKKAGCGDGGFDGGGDCEGGGGHSGGGAHVDGKSENLDLSGADGGGSFASYNNWSLLSGHCPVGNSFVITFSLS